METRAAWIWSSITRSEKRYYLVLSFLVRRDDKEVKVVEYTVKRPTKAGPSHPGALWREILDEHVKLPIAEAARRMKISRQSLYEVLNGGKVTAEMALRFGKLVGGDPSLYVRMQTNYDLWNAQQKLEAELRQIKTAQKVA
jgi:antitoxin HigA-1